MTEGERTVLKSPRYEMERGFRGEDASPDQLAIKVTYIAKKAASTNDAAFTPFAFKRWMTG
jgi:hypothetical protein